MLIPRFAITGLAGAMKQFEQAEKQIRFATARALTQTAKKAEKAIIEEMKRKFDRPTPYTLRSTFVKPATRDNLVSVVGIKDRSLAKSAAVPDELLAHEFKGGGRIWKSLEAYLARAGYIVSGEFVVPGAGARLDRYGNMSRGQVQQILSQLRLGLDPYSWKSKSARSKANVKKAGRIFWARGTVRDAHLPRGAWIDMGAPVGLRPLLVVTRKPNYRQRVDIARITAKTVADTWDETFARSLEDAFATTR